MAYWLLSSIVACIPANVSLRLEEITNYHKTVRKFELDSKGAPNRDKGPVLELRKNQG